MASEPDIAPGVVSLSPSLEDYLETIYQLVQEGHFARVKDIARSRAVKPGSVSPALKKLSDLGLVKYVQREYVGLTPEGEREARRVFSRHTVLTRFFHEILHMGPLAAEEQACSMEHSLSNEGMDRLVRFFEFLVVCPVKGADLVEMFRCCPLVHGHRSDSQPLCQQECVTGVLSQINDGGESLNVGQLTPGQRGKVMHVNADAAVRQRLLDMGILPNTLVEVERLAPNGDAIWVRLDGSQLALQRQEAEAVQVVRV